MERPPWLAGILLLVHWCTLTANAFANAKGQAGGQTQQGSGVSPPQSMSGINLSPRLQQPPPHVRPRSPTPPGFAFTADQDALALLVNLQSPYPEPVTIAAVHPSLLILSPTGAAPTEQDALRVGDEIVSIDGEPAWQLGAYGVQALVREAESDVLRLVVRPGAARDVAPRSVLVQRPSQCPLQAVKSSRRHNWGYAAATAADPLAAASSAIRLRCQHLSVPSRQIVEALDLVLPWNERGRAVQVASEDDDAAVAASVDHIVDNMAGDRKLAMLEEAFGAIMAVTLSATKPSGLASDALAPPASAMSPTSPAPGPVNALSSPQAQDGSDAGPGGQAVEMELCSSPVLALGRLRSTLQSLREVGWGAGGQQQLVMTRRMFDMLTLASLYGLSPDADFPPVMLPLQQPHSGVQGQTWRETSGNVSAAQRPTMRCKPTENAVEVVEWLLSESQAMMEANVQSGIDEDPANPNGEGIISAQAADALVAAAAVSGDHGEWGTHGDHMNLQRAYDVLSRLVMVGARPTTSARQLVLAAARRVLSARVTCVPATQARHVMQLLSERRLQLTSASVAVFLRALAAALLGDLPEKQAITADFLKCVLGILETGGKVLGLDADSDWLDARMQVMAVAFSIGLADLAEIDAVVEQMIQEHTLSSGMIATYARLSKSARLSPADSLTRITRAHEWFLTLPPEQRCADSYSALISALALLGDGTAALSLFEDAVQRESPEDVGGQHRSHNGAAHVRPRGFLLDARVFTAALRACDTPGQILEIHQKMLARNLVIDAETAAIVAAARRFADAERHVRTALKHAEKIQSQNQEAEKIRQNLRLRLVQSRAASPPPDYFAAPPEYALSDAVEKEDKVDSSRSEVESWAGEETAASDASKRGDSIQQDLMGVTERDDVFEQGLIGSDVGLQTAQIADSWHWHAPATSAEASLAAFSESSHGFGAQGPSFGQDAEAAADDVVVGEPGRGDVSSDSFDSMIEVPESCRESPGLRADHLESGQQVDDESQMSWQSDRMEPESGQCGVNVESKRRKQNDSSESEDVEEEAPVETDLDGVDEVLEVSAPMSAAEGSILLDVRDDDISLRNRDGVHDAGDTDAREGDGDSLAADHLDQEGSHIVSRKETHLESTMGESNLIDDVDAYTESTAEDMPDALGRRSATPYREHSGSILEHTEVTSIVDVGGGWPPCGERDVTDLSDPTSIMEPSCFLDDSEPTIESTLAEQEHSDQANSIDDAVSAVDNMGAITSSEAEDGATADKHDGTGTLPVSSVEHHDLLDTAEESYQEGVGEHFEEIADAEIYHQEKLEQVEEIDASEMPLLSGPEAPHQPAVVSVDPSDPSESYSQGAPAYTQHDTASHASFASEELAETVSVSGCQDPAAPSSSPASIGGKSVESSRSIRALQAVADDAEELMPVCDATGQGEQEDETLEHTLVQESWSTGALESDAQALEVSGGCESSLEGGKAVDARPISGVPMSGVTGPATSPMQAAALTTPQETLSEKDSLVTGNFVTKEQVYKLQEVSHAGEEAEVVADEVEEVVSRVSRQASLLCSTRLPVEESSMADRSAVDDLDDVIDDIGSEGEPQDAERSDEREYSHGWVDDFNELYRADTKDGAKAVKPLREWGALDTDDDELKTEKQSMVLDGQAVSPHTGSGDGTLPSESNPAVSDDLPVSRPALASPTSAEVLPTRQGQDLSHALEQAGPALSRPLQGLACDSTMLTWERQEGDKEEPEGSDQVVDLAYVHTVVKEGESYFDQGEYPRQQLRVSAGLREPAEAFLKSPAYGDPERSVWHSSAEIQSPTLRKEGEKAGADADEAVAAMQADVDVALQPLEEEVLALRGDDCVVGQEDGVDAKPVVEKPQGDTALKPEPAARRDAGTGMKQSEQMPPSTCHPYKTGTGQWTEVEERLLAQGMQRYPPGVARRWQLISDVVGSRNAKAAKRHGSDARVLRRLASLSQDSPEVVAATAGIEEPVSGHVGGEYLAPTTRVGVEPTPLLATDQTSINVTECRGQVVEAREHTLVQESWSTGALESDAQALGVSGGCESSLEGGKAVDARPMSGVPMSGVTGPATSPIQVAALDVDVTGGLSVEEPVDIGVGDGEQNEWQDGVDLARALAAVEGESYVDQGVSPRDIGRETSHTAVTGLAEPAEHCFLGPQHGDPSRACASWDPVPAQEGAAYAMQPPLPPTALTAEQSIGEAWRAVSTVHSHSGGEEGEWHSTRADVLEQSCDDTAAITRPVCDDMASMRVVGQLVLEEGRDAALSTGQPVDSEVQSSRVFERSVDDSGRAATASATVSEIAPSSADGAGERRMVPSGGEDSRSGRFDDESRSVVLSSNYGSLQSTLGGWSGSLSVSQGSRPWTPGADLETSADSAVGCRRRDGTVGDADGADGEAQNQQASAQNRLRNSEDHCGPDESSHGAGLLRDVGISSHSPPRSPSSHGAQQQRGNVAVPPPLALSAGDGVLSDGRGTYSSLHREGPDGLNDPDLSSEDKEQVIDIHDFELDSLDRKEDSVFGADSALGADSVFGSERRVGHGGVAMSEVGHQTDDRDSVLKDSSLPYEARQGRVPSRRRQAQLRYDLTESRGDSVFGTDDSVFGEGGHSSLHSLPSVAKLGRSSSSQRRRSKAHAEQEGFGDAGHDMF